MYALVKTGGKQYRVTKDDTILVEKLSAKEGEQVILSNIVLLGDGDTVTIGTPRVDGAGVSATVMRQTRGPKIIIFRRKRRKNHRRTEGHRQDLTLLKINEIARDAKSLKTKKPAAKEVSRRAAEPKRVAQDVGPAQKVITKEPTSKPAVKKTTAKKPAVKNNDKTIDIRHAADAVFREKGW